MKRVDCYLCRRLGTAKRPVTPYAIAGTTRPICSDCRLIPTLDTVLLRKLLLEQVAEHIGGGE